MLKKNGKSKSDTGPREGYPTWEDDEYGQIVDDVKRIYKAKIKPLEVTYNFEGKQANE
jgi:hypothetical protein